MALNGEHYRQLLGGNKFRLAGVALDLMKYRRATITHLENLKKIILTMKTALKDFDISQIEDSLKATNVEWERIVRALGSSKEMDYWSSTDIGGLEKLQEPWAEAESANPGGDEAVALRKAVDDLTKAKEEHQEELDGVKLAAEADMKRLEADYKRIEADLLAEKLKLLTSETERKRLVATVTDVPKETTPVEGHLDTSIMRLRDATPATTTTTTATTTTTLGLPGISLNSISSFKEPKIFSLSPSSPTLNAGDVDMKVIDWLFRIETEFTLRRIPDEMKILSVLAYVKGYYFELARKYIDSNNNNWKNFKIELLRKTDPREIDYKLKTRLYALKQDGSFDKFITEFEFLTNKITDLTESAKFDLFMRGINPKIHIELKVRNILILDDCIKIAHQLDQLYFTRNKTENVAYSKVHKK